MIKEVYSLFQGNNVIVLSKLSGKTMIIILMEHENVMLIKLLIGIKSRKIKYLYFYQV